MKFFNSNKESKSNKIEEKVTYPYLDKHKDEVLASVDKSSDKNLNEYITLGLYFNGKKLNEEDKYTLSRIEANLKENMFRMIEDEREYIQDQLDIGSLYLDPKKELNWSEVIGDFIDKGGKIKNLKYLNDRLLSWNLIESMDKTILKHEAQKNLEALEKNDFKYKKLSAIDYFFDKGGIISDLKTKDGVQLDAGNLLKITKNYYITKVEYNLRKIERNPKYYSDTLFEKFEEEYGDLSYIKTIEGKHLGWKYLIELKKKGIKYWLQKNIWKLEENLQEKKFKNEVVLYLDWFNELKGELSELKRKDGEPITEDYLNYIIKY